MIKRRKKSQSKPPVYSGSIETQRDLRMTDTTIGCTDSCSDIQPPESVDILTAINTAENTGHTSRVVDRATSRCFRLPLCMRSGTSPPVVHPATVYQRRLCEIGIDPQHVSRRSHKQSLSWSPTSRQACTSGTPLCMRSHSPNIWDRPPRASARGVHSGRQILRERCGRRSSGGQR